MPLDAGSPDSGDDFNFSDTMSSLHLPGNCCGNGMAAVGRTTGRTPGLWLRTLRFAEKHRDKPKQTVPIPNTDTDSFCISTE
jgi:hypothetical protein